MRPIDIREGRPDRDSKESDDAKDGSQRQTRQDFPLNDAPPIGQAHLAKRQRTNDECSSLRSGVAATGNDQRDEQCQHDCASDFSLKHSHRCGGQHLSKEECSQPPGALANEASERDVHVRLVEGFRSSDALDLPGCGRFRDI